MREIKFRAWDRENKKFLENWRSAYMDIWDGVVYELNGGFDGVDATMDYLGVDIMQYTGLKDRTGREIFEGDIIKDIGSGHLYEVVFDDYLACFCKRKIKPRSDNDYSHDFLMREFIGVNYEIVGNIHENSELLK